MSKKVEEFMQKIQRGKKKNSSRLDKFREDICLLREVHKCSFNQIRDYLIEQKIHVSVTAIANYYNAIEKMAKKQDEVAVFGMVKQDKNDTKPNGPSALDTVKKLWEK